MEEMFMLNDDVFNSPVGAGKITGITSSGYPKVDQIAVARLAIKIREGQFLIYDANGSYARGEWEMFIDDERFPSDKENSSVVIVRSSHEAIAFCQAVRSLPRRIMFDHDLGGDDTSMRFINWMISQLYEDNPTFKLREDFQFSIHSQNPVGARNIKGTMQSLLNDYFGVKQFSLIAFRFLDNDFHDPLKRAIEYVNEHKLEALTLDAFKEYVVRGMVGFSSLTNISLWGFKTTKFIDRSEYFNKHLSLISLGKIEDLPQEFEGYVLDTETGNAWYQCNI